jgi:hypothetical protein
VGMMTTSGAVVARQKILASQLVEAHSVAEPAVEVETEPVAVAALAALAVGSAVLPALALACWAAGDGKRRVTQQSSSSSLWVTGTRRRCHPTLATLPRRSLAGRHHHQDSTPACDATVRVSVQLQQQQQREQV